MAPVVYSTTLAGLLLVASPYLLPKVIVGRHGIKERLGLLPPEVEHVSAREAIWFHAASVGEVSVVAVVVHELRKIVPDCIPIVSTVTTSGKRRAPAVIEDLFATFLLPIDLPWPVRRVLRKVQPRALVIAETELWPNLILETKKYGASLALINGRLSKKSARRYEIAGRIFSRVLSAFDTLCVRTDEDLGRLLHLGADRKNMAVVGDIKFDQVLLQCRGVDSLATRGNLPISPHRQVVVAGSTRPGEEEEILTAFCALNQGGRGPVLILAPRHLHRVDVVVRKALQRGLRAVKRSKASERGEEPDVIVVDTMGDLLRFYSVADVAFVGGSLKPFGGHNPLEPAGFGIPVLFGPYMENNRRGAELLQREGGGITVCDGGDMAQVLSRLLDDGGERERRGKAARHVLEAHAGAAKRTAELLAEMICRKQ